MKNNLKTVVSQTSRTLIIEKFNSADNAPSLTKIFGSLPNADVFTSNDFNMVKKDLMFETFEEFIQKIEPVVYQSAYEDSDGQHIVYSIDETPDSKPVKLRQHQFYRMLEELIRKKKGSGKANIDFDYSVIRESLSPENEYKHLKELRAQAENCYKLAMKSKSKGREEEAKVYMLRCRENMKNINKGFGNSIVAALPIKIADLNTMIEAKETMSGQSSSGDTVLIEDNKPKVGLLKMKEDGTLYVEEKKTEQSESGNEDSEKMSLALWEQSANSVAVVKENPFLKNTYLSLFNDAKREEMMLADVSELKDLKNVYEQVYAESQQSFFDAIYALARKVLDVEMFFEHAGDKNGHVRDGVIIVNNTMQELLANEKMFRQFLENVNNTSKDKIWFAVLPSAYNEQFPSQEASSMDNLSFDDLMNGDFVDDDEFEEDSNESKKTNLDQINNMSNILGEYGIISVFNFAASNKTGFNEFDENTLDAYKEAMEFIQSDKAVLAYPNFNIIPNEERNVDVSENIKFTVPGLFVDSAYVAAGILAATQNIEILKSKDYKVLDNNPCVHFDLEDGDNKIKFQTVFNRENILSYKESLKQKIADVKLGFCFSGDTIYDKEGKTVMRSYVQLARTVSDGKRISHVLTENCIADYANKMLDTVSSVEEFIKDLSYFLEVQDAQYPQYVNRLLYTNEKIEYKEEDGVGFIDVILKDSKKPSRIRVRGKAQ